MQHPGFSALATPRAEPGSLANRATPIKVEGKEPRYGCLRMVVGSSHELPLTDAAGKPVMDPRTRRPVKVRTTARDRRLFPGASGFLFCLHPDCAGKAWQNEAELLRAHPSQIDMGRERQIHVIGFFSPDAAEPPREDCAACKAATKKASAAATAEARKANKDAAEVFVAAPCEEHSGGVIGLLTPGEPATLD